MIATLVALIATAAAPQFEVRSLGGQTVVGTVERFDADQITIRTAEGPVSLKTDDLLGIASKPKPTPPAEEPAAWIDLIDGSSLVARQYSVINGRTQATLLGGQTVGLPAGSVSSVRLTPQTDTLAAEWSRLSRLKIDTDLLVIRKGESIDYHKGILRDVTDTLVHFDLGGDAVPVNRSKVDGLLYYRVLADPLPETVCRLTDADGSQWSAASLALTSDLQWTTPTGLSITRSLAAVAEIDFSRGKVLFLGDLRPESVEFTPYFGGRDDVPVLAEFYTPRPERSLESGRLRLDGTTYDRGLALHSRTKVVYRLPGRFRRFKATIGIDDAVRPHGHVRLVILGDENVLLEATVTGTDPPMPVDLDLAGIRRLAVLADFGDQLDTADHLDLCEARILK
ncbi:MAG: NPCBM/NEW2 domain-containing protein [Pirellulales bacterium]|nr:NPCBM/NEW2 domain-containing protein [Pirellulales bacterium]